MMTGFVIFCATMELSFFVANSANTLERFVFAIENKEDDCVIVRLTADNYVPDGTLIDEVVQEYLEKNEPYMLCNGRPCGLPYGMSVEVTRAKYLRKLRRIQKTNTIKSTSCPIFPENMA